MDLKEAIRKAEFDCGATGVQIMPWLPAIMNAARRELERQEKEKPTRASLRQLEHDLRAAARYDHEGWDKAEIQAADILKALRETMVPALKNATRNFAHGTWTFPDGTMCSPLDMLRALGEEP